MSVIEYKVNGETFYTHETWLSLRQRRAWHNIPTENNNLALYYSLSTLAVLAIVSLSVISGPQETPLGFNLFQATGILRWVWSTRSRVLARVELGHEGQKCGRIELCHRNQRLPVHAVLENPRVSHWFEGEGQKRQVRGQQIRQQKQGQILTKRTNRKIQARPHSGKPQSRINPPICEMIIDLKVYCNRLKFVKFWEFRIELSFLLYWIFTLIFGYWLYLYLMAIGLNVKNKSVFRVFIMVMRLED